MASPTGPVILRLGAKNVFVDRMLGNPLINKMYPKTPPIVLHASKEQLGWGAATLVSATIYKNMFDAVLNELATSAGLGRNWRSKVDVVTFGREFDRTTEISKLGELLDLPTFSSAGVWFEVNSEPYLMPFQPAQPVLRRPTQGVVDLPLRSLEFDMRAFNCLARTGIYRVGDLVMYREDELSKIPNFGRRSLEGVKEVIENRGLRLGMSLSQVIDLSVFTSREEVRDAPFASYFPLDATTTAALQARGIETIGDMALTPHLSRETFKDWGSPKGDAALALDCLLAFGLKKEMNEEELVAWQEGELWTQLGQTRIS